MKFIVARMGKAGKERKRRKLESGLIALESIEQDNEDEYDSDDSKEVTAEDIQAASALLDAYYFDFRDAYFSKDNKPLRTMLWPLIQLQLKAHFEIIPPLSQHRRGNNNPLRDDELSLLRKVALYFTSSNEGKTLFLAAQCRNFRRALHPFVLIQLDPTRAKMHLSNGDREQEDDRSFSGRISNAFRARDWASALKLLREMSLSDEILRLGALQRWVRDCDIAATDESNSDGKNSSLLLLDAVMRVGQSNKAPSSSQLRPDLFKTEGAPTLHTRAIVERFTPFSPSTEHTWDPSSADHNALNDTDPVFSVVHSVPGADRKPPSPYPLNIFSTAPKTIAFAAQDIHASKRCRLDVPGVPGAFLMTGILSPTECRRIISVASALGYRPDAVDDIDNIVWLADSSLWQPIYERCLPMLPARVGKCHLRGLNARFRLFRYFPGAVYRPHIDGAWPGSGLNAQGEYTDDAFSEVHDKRYSKLTFLVYLNDVSPEANASAGGSTTFFLPSTKGFGHIEARSVIPRQGNVLCFPHGDTSGSLVHEGSEVAKGGVKYIIRTDVLYSVD